MTPGEKKDEDLEHILNHAGELAVEIKKAGKLYYKSKTFWFNVASIAMIVGTWMLGYEKYAGYGAVIIASANLYLRKVTDTPLVVR